MSEVRIVAEPRTEFGKGAARRVRRANKVPAVLYGHGDAPRHVSLPGHELMIALRRDPNVLLTLVTDQGDQLALPKAVVRDPIKGHLEHVDLVSVRRGEKVTVEVPLTLQGEAGPDVLVDQQLTTLSVEAEATHLPSEVVVSIDGLQAGGSVTAGSLTLPQGSTLVTDAEMVVVQGLATPSTEELEADLASSEAELGAGAAGSETVTDGAETDAVDLDAGTGTGDAVAETDGPKTDA